MASVLIVVSVNGHRYAVDREIPEHGGESDLDTVKRDLTGAVNQVKAAMAADSWDVE